MRREVMYFCADTEGVRIYTGVALSSRTKRKRILIWLPECNAVTNSCLENLGGAVSPKVLTKRGNSDLRPVIS